MRIEITNNQKIKKINLKDLSRCLEKILTFLKIPLKSVSFSFCDNKEIKRLNKRYFNKNTATDVIAFALFDDLNKDYLGEVVVSVEEAVKVGKKLKCRWQQELLLYLVHGVLHLIGFDDRTDKKRKLMEKKQTQIMRLF